MTQPISATAPAPMSPPVGAGGGFSKAPAVAMPPQPKKGGLPIKVIASLQGVYEKEEQKQEQLQGMDKPLQLKTGWGGQGR